MSGRCSGTPARSAGPPRGIPGPGRSRGSPRGPAPAPEAPSTTAPVHEAPPCFPFCSLHEASVLFYPDPPPVKRGTGCGGGSQGGRWTRFRHPAGNPVARNSRGTPFLLRQPSGRSIGDFLGSFLHRGRRSRPPPRGPEGAVVHVGDGRGDLPQRGSRKRLPVRGVLRHQKPPGSRRESGIRESRHLADEPGGRETRGSSFAFGSSGTPRLWNRPSVRFGRCDMPCSRPCRRKDRTPRAARASGLFRRRAGTVERACRGRGGSARRPRSHRRALPGDLPPKTDRKAST